MPSYLVTGGTRSGKSSFALQLAASAERPFYIATGWAGDGEMEVRIEKHRKERGDRWRTIETRTEVPAAIARALSELTDFILVDCLTLWTSNLMFEQKDVNAAVAELIRAIPDDVPIVFVTNELGSGIVPDNKLARDFRDEAGRVNQAVAAAVENVYLTVCGIPVKIK